MGTATSASFSEAPGSEPRTLAALLLESIALRHQIAVLERSRTRRPCFRLWDRLFWILFSRWWPQWRDSLIVVHSETVLRWRRDGWSALWRYRARGRWRGGRPRISSEVRHLIIRMARENFLWGAPRIHGEHLMLGFSVSQATVSRYMPARSRIMEDFPSGSRRVRHQAITDQLTRIAGRLGQLAAQLGLSPAAERALRHDAALEVSHRKWLALAEDGGDREARSRAIRQHAGARRYGRHVDRRIHRAGPNEARAVFRAGLDLATAPDWLQRPTCQTRPLPETPSAPAA
jgi:hypothetical protein